MILLSMTDEEKWKQIKQERTEIFAVLKKMAPFIYRHILTDQKRIRSRADYPYLFSRRFMSNAGNRKLVVVKISDKKALKDFMYDINYSIRSYTLLDAGAKGTYVYNDVPQTRDRLDIYIPHYWSRYRERMHLGEEMSFDDLLAHHYKYNSTYSMRVGDIPNLKKHENGFFATSGSGISWGIKYEGNIYKFNTFMTVDMMKGEEQMTTYLVDEVQRILAEKRTGAPQFHPVDYRTTNVKPVRKSLIDAAMKSRQRSKIAVGNAIEMLKEDINRKERKSRLWSYRMKRCVIKMKAVFIKWLK